MALLSGRYLKYLGKLTFILAFPFYCYIQFYNGYHFYHEENIRNVFVKQFYIIIDILYSSGNLYQNLLKKYGCINLISFYTICVFCTLDFRAFCKCRDSQIKIQQKSSFIFQTMYSCLSLIQFLKNAACFIILLARYIQVAVVRGELSLYSLIIIECCKAEGAGNEMYFLQSFIHFQYTGKLKNVFDCNQLKYTPIKVGTCVERLNILANEPYHSRRHGGKRRRRQFSNLCVSCPVQLVYYVVNSAAKSVGTDLI